jgi:ribosome modulation factor
MLDAKKIDAAVSAVERFKSRVDRYADAGFGEYGGKVTRQVEGARAFQEGKPLDSCPWKLPEDRKKWEQGWKKAQAEGRSDAEEQQESKSRSKETTHNKETRQSKDGEKHVVETKQTSEPQQDDPPDPEAKAASGESKAAVNALKTKIAQDKKEERYAKREDAMKPDPNMSAEKMDKMVSTTEKLVSRMDAYDARNRSDDYGHPIASGFRTQEQERRSDSDEAEIARLKRLLKEEFSRLSNPQKESILADIKRLEKKSSRSDDTVTQEEKNIHHTITKHQQDEKEDDEESDAKGGDNPRKDAKKR